MNCESLSVVVGINIKNLYKLLKSANAKVEQKNKNFIECFYFLQFNKNQERKKQVWVGKEEIHIHIYTSLCKYTYIYISSCCYCCTAGNSEILGTNSYAGPSFKAMIQWT